MMDPTQSQAQVMGPSEGTAWDNQKNKKTKNTMKNKHKNGADQKQIQHIYFFWFLWSAPFFFSFS